MLRGGPQDARRGRRAGLRSQDAARGRGGSGDEDEGRGARDVVLPAPEVPAAAAPEIVDNEAYRCSTCGEINRRKHRMVMCNQCERWSHVSCTGMTFQQAEQIPVWHCAECFHHAPVDTAPPPGPQQDITAAGVARLQARCKAGVRVLPRVPKAARIQVASAFTTALTRARVEKTPHAWARLSTFAYGTLQAPAKTRTQDPAQPALATIVKRQVAEFLASDGLPAPQDRADGPRRQPGEDGDRLRQRVAAKFADGDVRGAVRVLASGEGFAERTPGTIHALMEKHPPSPPDQEMPPPPDDQLAPPIVVTVEEVAASVASFPPGTAAGPDGLRPLHLQQLTGRGTGEAGAQLLKALTAFTNMALRGELPNFALPYFYGASLLALNKKDGGIRPIAVGNSLRRLVTKAGLKPLSEALGEELRPVQLGFATKGGCEAAIHATRRYIDHIQGRRVILKIDMRNAFNTIRRDAFLKVARLRAPRLYPLLWQAYSSPSILHFGETAISSATGLQQGDPIGPALFSLGVDAVSRTMSSELNVWYLDDATFGGPVEQVLADCQTIQGELARAGLEVNDAKCELFLLNHHGREEEQQAEEQFRNILPGVRVLREDQQALLGSPLTQAATAPAIRVKKEALELMVSRLVQVDSHPALVLLKNCFAIPKLLHLLRTTAAYMETVDLRAFDDVIRRTVTTISNVHFDDTMWTQAVLPVGLGGLGVRCSYDVALPGYIASLHSTGPLVDAILSQVHGLAPAAELVEAAITTWRERSGSEEEPEGRDRAKQSAWDIVAAKKTLEGILSRANQVARARLLAAARQESGLWLHAIPIPSLGTHLDAQTLRIAVAHRVGASVCRRHTCKCGRVTDVFGHHALSCRFSAGRLPRHSAINDVVKRALQSAGLPAHLEPQGIDRGDGKRPDGITIVPYKNGRCLVWDATCVDTFSATNIIASAVTPATAAGQAEERKRHKYRVLAENYHFEPFAVETTGVFGPTTLKTVDEIGRRLTAETGEPRETLWLKQRIGIAILRGNAFSVLATPKHDIDL
jgi:hypothetical protein